MSWFLVALLGYIALAIVFVLDKRILTESVQNPVVYTFYSTIFMLAIFFAWPFGVELLVGMDWVWALVSGLGFGFGLWALFIAVKHGEASHVNPFIGAITTVATFAIASVFLGEVLTTGQLYGMILLALATFLLSFIREDGTIFFDKGYLWGFVAGLCFAVSHTTAKHVYDLYPFLTGLVWTRGTIGLVGILTLAYPSVRAALTQQSPEQKKHMVEKPATKAHTIAIVVVAKGLGVVGTLLIQLAIALGSVTLVNALVGLQYALMFVFIYLLTRFAPTVFRESFTRIELAVETIAIILVVIGSALFVV